MIFSWLAFFLYRHLLVPSLNFFAKLFFPLMKGKTREFLSDRFDATLPPIEASCIWIHASSGEVEYAKSVIRALKTEWPQKPIVVSYFSPSAKKLIKNFPGIDVSFAVPLENPKTIQKYIQHFRPECLLIARTDVWPEFVYQFRLQNIPSFLFSATLASESSRKGLITGQLSKFAFNQLSEIHCVSEGDLNEFKSLNLQTPLFISGDTRYDQVLYRIQHPAHVKGSLKPLPDEKIFVCGSTWPQDELVLIPALPRLKKLGYRTILAPHEISQNHLETIQQKLQQQGLRFSLYSQVESWTSDVLIVDHIGCLQELYTWGSIGFVGGSFKDKIHSVMEPLAAGLPVLVGPFHENNREALQFQHSLVGEFGAVCVVRNSDDFVFTIEKIELNLEKFRSKILQKIIEKSGSAKRLLNRLKGSEKQT